MTPSDKTPLTDRVARRIPVVRALGGADGVRDAAATINNELQSEGAAVTLRELAGAAPRLVQLIWRIARDSRVPRHVRLALPAVALYLVSPIDFIPDFLPGIGGLDDAVVAVIAVRWLLGRVDIDILREHWEGADAMLEVLLRLTGHPVADADPAPVDDPAS